MGTRVSTRRNLVAELGLNPDLATPSSWPSMRSGGSAAWMQVVYLPNRRNLTQSCPMRTPRNLRGRDRLPAPPSPAAAGSRNPRGTKPMWKETETSTPPAVVPAGGREPEHPPGCQKSPRKKRLLRSPGPRLAPRGGCGTCFAG